MPPLLKLLLAGLTAAAVLAAVLLLEDGAMTTNPDPGDPPDPPSSPARVEPAPPRIEPSPVAVSSVVAAPAEPAAEPLAASSPRVPVGGDVLDQAGRPVAQARVHASWEPLGSRTQHTRVVHSDGAGHFSLGLLEPGSLRLRADAPGTQSWVSGPLAVGARGEPLHVLITLELSASLEVTLRDLDGAPLVDREIVAQLRGDQPSWLARTHRAVSDGDGRASLRGLESGHWTVSAIGRIVELELAAGEQRTLSLTVAPEPTLLPVAGVVQRHGRPVEGVAVMVVLRDDDGEDDFWDHATTDAVGRFAFEVPGDRGGVRVMATASAPGLDVWSSELLAPVTDLRLSVDWSRLSVVARHPDGRPASGLVLGLHTPGYPEPWRTVPVEALGLADFGWVPAGDWELRSRSARKSSTSRGGSRAVPGQASLDVQIAPGSDVDQLAFVVPRLGTLVGDVVPEPPTPVTIQLWPEGQRIHTLQVLSEPHGRFAVDGLPPGRWHVAARIDTRRACPEDDARVVVIEPGHRTSVVLDAPVR